jgi:hypothetical protein
MGLPVLMDVEKQANRTLNFTLFLLKFLTLAVKETDIYGTLLQTKPFQS